MNEHNQKLADFVIEQYNKVKKAKKSPKNFFVYEQDRDISNSTFYLRKECGLSFCIGNLNALYLDVVDLKATLSEQIENKVEGISKTSDPYKGFDLTWIPVLKNLLKYQMPATNWQNLDNLEQGEFKTEENFNNFLTWLKS